MSKCVKCGRTINSDDRDANRTENICGMCMKKGRCVKCDNWLQGDDKAVGICHWCKNK